jgi:hypothetical protein
MARRTARAKRLRSIGNNAELHRIPAIHTGISYRQSQSLPGKQRAGIPSPYRQKLTVFTVRTNPGTAGSIPELPGGSENRWTSQPHLFQALQRSRIGKGNRLATAHQATSCHSIWRHELMSQQPSCAAISTGVLRRQGAGLQPRLFQKSCAQCASREDLHGRWLVSANCSGWRNEKRPQPRNGRSERTRHGRHDYPACGLSWYR